MKLHSQNPLKWKTFISANQPEQGLDEMRTNCVMYCAPDILIGNFTLEIVLLFIIVVNKLVDLCLLSLFISSCIMFVILLSLVANTNRCLRTTSRDFHLRDGNTLKH